MTAADEYQRVLNRCRSSRPAFIREADGVDWHRGVSICTCGETFAGAHAAHVAQALAADPGVRAAVEREARAEAWDEGHRVGWEHCQDGNYGVDYWDDDTPTPYRQEPGDGE